MGLQKWVFNALFEFPKLIEDMVGIIKIVESIEADYSERKSGMCLTTKVLRQNRSLGKSCSYRGWNV